MTVLAAIYGASPVNDSDATQHNFSADTSQNTNVATLDNMPGDFLTMDSSGFTLHVECQLDGAGSGDTYHLLAGIRKTSSGTQLAGGPVSGNATVDSDVAHTTWTTFDVDLSGAGGYVDVTATKADWDAADVWLQQAYTKDMGGDNQFIQVRRAWITGNYTAEIFRATAPARLDRLRKRGNLINTTHY